MYSQADHGTLFSCLSQLNNVPCQSPGKPPAWSPQPVSTTTLCSPSLTTPPPADLHLMYEATPACLLERQAAECKKCSNVHRTHDGRIKNNLGGQEPQPPTRHQPPAGAAGPAADVSLLHVQQRQRSSAGWHHFQTTQEAIVHQLPFRLYNTHTQPAGTSYASPHLAAQPTTSTGQCTEKHAESSGRQDSSATSASSAV